MGYLPLFQNPFAWLWYAGIAGLIGSQVWLWPPTWYFSSSSSSSSSSSAEIPFVSIVAICGAFFLTELLHVVSYRYHRLLRHPPIPPTTTTLASPSYHIVVACHGLSFHNLQSLTFNLLHSTQNKAEIWVAFNGNQPPQDQIDMQHWCLQHGIHYVFYPLASKTHALYTTIHDHVQHSFPLVEKQKYVVLLDDDTQLPPGFAINTKIFESDAQVAGYCCCIGVRKDEDHFSIWEHLVDFEYRTISWRNEIQQYHGTLDFLHGIICVYRLDAFLEIYRRNPCLPPGQLPFGEDSYAGLDARLHGWKLKQDNSLCVYTYCPRQVFNFRATYTQGYGASSLFKQRAMRWYLSWPRRFCSEIGLCFFYDAGTWWGNVLYRVHFLKKVCITFSATFWFLFLIKLIVHRSNMISYGVLHGVLALVSILNAYLRYWAMDESVKDEVRWFVPAAYPLLLLTNSFCMGVAFLVAVLWYIPMYRRLRR